MRENKNEKLAIVCFDRAKGRFCIYNQGLVKLKRAMIDLCCDHSEQHTAKIRGDKPRIFRFIDEKS